jgi:hypothetical protein
MDDTNSPQHHAPVRVLPHIKRLDDCFGDFLVRVTCPCGASRHIEPEALARIAGRAVTLASLAARMRCLSCGKKVAEVVTVAGREECRRVRTAKPHERLKGSCPTISCLT